MGQYTKYIHVTKAYPKSIQNIRNTKCNIKILDIQNLTSKYMCVHYMPLKLRLNSSYIYSVLKSWDEISGSNLYTLVLIIRNKQVLINISPKMS